VIDVRLRKTDKQEGMN